MIKNEHRKIVDLYRHLFHDMFNVWPEINIAQCSNLLDQRLENQPENVICEIIKLYFEKEPKGQVFHLPTILSAYTFNKYLPELKVDPNLYTNSDEINN